MALQKTIKTNYGVNANYLKITNISLSFNGHCKASGDLSLYLNQNARQDEANILDNFKFSYDLSEAEAIGDLRAILYIKITESILSDDLETNLLSGNIGQIGFQEAENV
jgi:hypothetical protein